MADSNASGAPRKRAKMGDQSPNGRMKRNMCASEDGSFDVAQKNLDHKKRLVSYMKSFRDIA